MQERRRLFPLFIEYRANGPERFFPSERKCVGRPERLSEKLPTPLYSGGEGSGVRVVPSKTGPSPQPLSPEYKGEGLSGFALFPRNQLEALLTELPGVTNLPFSTW